MALLLGYLLADAQDPVSVMIVACAIIALTIPLMMKWYHPLLVVAWNMSAMPALPGRPALWAIVAFVGLLVVLLNRSITDEENRLSPVPMLTWPMLALAVVIGMTAMATGGISLGIFRSGNIGGKNYFYLFSAIAGFFVLASKAVPRERAAFYAALFFLPGMLAAASRVASWIGPSASFVYYLFPADFDVAGETLLEGNPLSQTRLRGVALAATMVFFWLLARVGVRGLFDFSRPWRAGLAVLLLGAGTLGGFRSITIVMFMTFVVLFFVEKLWRTRVALVMAGLLILASALLVGFSKELPFTVQRALSFLPLDFDPGVELSARDSSEWRLEMWREAWKQVPAYLFRGKGYNLNWDDMYMTAWSMQSGRAQNWEGALMAGDYHNGPLSLLITFGIYGFIAFIWLIVAGIRYLYVAYRDSLPELRRINALLLALFVVRAIFFLTLYGAIAHDLYLFTGILGLSVALNIPHRAKESEQSAPSLEPSPQTQTG